ncbi:MAG: hypothetical protein GY759_11500 [Chloroflexi bacterium]|nr:hypothetical protein [Chloroflexota bacterium]
MTTDLAHQIEWVFAVFQRLATYHNVKLLVTPRTIHDPIDVRSSFKVCPGVHKPATFTELTIRTVHVECADIQNSLGARVSRVFVQHRRHCLK